MCYYFRECYLLDFQPSLESVLLFPGVLLFSGVLLFPKIRYTVLEELIFHVKSCARNLQVYLEYLRYSF